MKKILLLVLTFIALSCAKEPLTIDLGGNIVIEINEQYTIPFTYSPSDEIPPIQFTTDNPNIASVNSEGIVTGHHVGTTTLYAIVNATYMAECLVIVTEATVKSVILNHSELKMNIGDTETLYGKVEPSFVDSHMKKLSWSTTDDSIISIRALTECKVTAIGEGTAKVIAKSVNGITDTCIVEVSRVPLEGISFVNPTISMEETDVLPLDITFNPANATNKNISYVIADEDIVEVIDGKIYAKAIGETIITVTSEEGGHTAACNVKVSLKGIEVTMFEDKMLIGSSTVAWSKSIATGEAYLDAIWESSNPYVASVVGEGNGTNSAAVTAHNPGTTVITAWSKDYAKCGNFTLTVADITELVRLKGTLIFDNVVNFRGQVYNDSNEQIILCGIYAIDNAQNLVHYIKSYDVIIYPHSFYNLEEISLPYISTSVFYTYVCQFEFRGEQYEVSYRVFY